MGEKDKKKDKNRDDGIALPPYGIDNDSSPYGVPSTNIPFSAPPPPPYINAPPPFPPPVHQAVPHLPYVSNQPYPPNPPYTNAYPYGQPPIPNAYDNGIPRGPFTPYNERNVPQIPMYGKRPEPGYPSFGVPVSSPYYMPSPSPPSFPLPPPPPPPVVTGSGSVGVDGAYPDVEAGRSMLMAEQKMRLGFIRKVLGILSVQIAITAGVSSAFLYVKPLQKYVETTQWIFYTCLGVSVVFMLILTCSDRVRRTWPYNIIALIIFTCAEALLLGSTIAFFNVKAVLMAVVTTAGVFIITWLLTILFPRQVDLTQKRSLFLIPFLALMVLAIIAGVWERKAISLVVAGLGAALFSALLLYDLQMIVGRSARAIGPDEYIFASLAVYLDVINIFMCSLQFFQMAGGN